MPTEFKPVEVSRDGRRLVEFLCDDEWPFHGQHCLTVDDVAEMEFSSHGVESYWIIERHQTVGLVRLLDLDDIGQGSPLFDLRIAGPHRGFGFGHRATRWIVDHLFTNHPVLHRIEAHTRHDNTAMQRTLSGAGFVREGRLRDAWRSTEGQWFDTMIYGLLRRDWTTPDEG